MAETTSPGISEHFSKTFDEKLSTSFGNASRNFIVIYARRKSLLFISGNPQKFLCNFFLNCSRSSQFFFSIFTYQISDFFQESEIFQEPIGSFSSSFFGFFSKNFQKQLLDDFLRKLPEDFLKELLRKFLIEIPEELPKEFLQNFKRNF